MTLRFTAEGSNVDATMTHDAQSVRVNTTSHEGIVDAPSGPLMQLQKPGTHEWEGSSLSLAEYGNGVDFNLGMRARVYRRMEVVSSVSGRNLYFDNLTDNTTREDTIIGGNALVIRYNNGVGSEVGEYEVTDGNQAAWILLHGAGTGYTQAGGFSYRIPAVAANSHTYHFAVAAIDGSNQAGTLATVAYAGPADVSAEDGDAADNSNTVDLGSNYTEGGSLAAPANLTATADASGADLVNLTWDAVATATAYIVFISWNVAPGSIPATPYFELEAAADGLVQAGDLVYFSKKMSQPSQSMVSARVMHNPNAQIEKGNPGGMYYNDPALAWSYEYREFGAGDLAPTPAAQDESPGDEYYRVTVDAGTAQFVAIQGSYHRGSMRESDNAKAVLQAGTVIKWEMWMRASKSLDVTVNIKATSSSAWNTVSLTTSWQLVTFSETITAVDTSTTLYSWQVRLDMSSEGSDEYVDMGANRVYDSAEGDFLEVTAKELTVAPAGVFWRDHTQIKTVDNSNDMQSLTAATGCSNRQYTLQTFLDFCVAVSGKPWFQLEHHFSLADFDYFMDWLCAPVASGRAGALRRQAAGRTEPWIDAFSRVLFEIGNEAWNPQEDFWNYPASIKDQGTGSVIASSGESFAIRCNMIAARMKAHTYWNSKIEFSFGGRQNRNEGDGWTEGMATGLDHTGRLTIAAYNGGWDNASSGATPLAPITVDYDRIREAGPVLLEGVYDRLLQGISDNVADGVTLTPDIYEAGPNYFLSGLGNVVMNKAASNLQEVAMKSVCGVVGTTEAWLLGAVRGFKSGNFFTFGEGKVWRTHAVAAEGGGVYPCWLFLKKLQDYMNGNAFVSTSTIVTPDTFAIQDYQDVNTTASKFFIYGLTPVDNATRRIIIMGNRHGTDNVQPTLLTNIKSATSLKLVDAGATQEHHNVYPVGKRLASTPEIYGAGQTGTTIRVANVAWIPQAASVWTIDGSDYTVSSASGFDKSIDGRADVGDIVFTTSVSSAPDDGLEISSDEVDADGYVADTNCVSITMAEQDITVPADLNQLVPNAAMGVGASGLAPGQTAMWVFDGVVEGIS